MSDDIYLREVLRAQEVKPDSQEMRDLQAARAEIEGLIRKEFDACGPTIRYGGSKAKNTMNLEDYDLDVIVYFPRTDTAAGTTIKEIYKNVQKALEKKYLVDPKTTALRVKSTERDLKIDVVPGRFVDDKEADAYVHQNDPRPDGKEYLKTNLDKHIEHIRDSTFVPEVRLMKLWRPCAGIEVKTFPLELVTVKILKRSAPDSHSSRLTHVLETIRDEIETIAIEDPANGGNDLSSALSNDVRQRMALAARSTLQSVARAGWSSVFDRVAIGSTAQREEARRVSVISSPPRPRPHQI